MATGEQQTELAQEMASTAPKQDYLLGYRGFLTIQALLWVFLQTFLPTTVKGSANTSGPTYQIVLRKSLSVLFWNESLIYSAFILLSGRTVCIPFFRNPSKTSVASAAFRRGLRLFIPALLAMAIVKILMDIDGVDYITEFAKTTGNESISAPYHMSSVLVYFNSVFDLFWTTYDFSKGAGSKAFPTGTLWILSVVYQQSYTAYMTMITIPYTRPAWRIQALVVFILTAFWVQSWAWYTITGLLLADAVMNMDFKRRSQHGMPIWKTNLHVPIWILYSLLMAGGLTMQYMWTAWRPASGNVELLGHAGLYYTGGLNTDYDLIEPQARDDNYVLLVGFFLLMETSDLAQRILSNHLFMWLGERSLSYFLLSNTIVYSAGIRLYLKLHHHHTTSVKAKVIAAAACVGLIIICAELFHRAVDRSSKWLALKAFDWIRE